MKCNLTKSGRAIKLLVKTGIFTYLKGLQSPKQNLMEKKKCQAKRGGDWMNGFQFTKTGE